MNTEEIKIVAEHRTNKIRFETDDMLELVRFASERHTKLSSFDITIYCKPIVPVQYIDMKFKI